MEVKGKLLTAIAVSALAIPTMGVNANPADIIQQSMTMRACIDLNVREDASSNSQIMGVMEKGDLIDVVANDGMWYAVEYGDEIGYAYGEYLTYVSNTDGSFDEGLANEYPGYDLYGNKVGGTNDDTSYAAYESDVSYLDIMMSSDFDVNMRTMPSMAGDVIGVLPAFTEIHVVSTVNGGAWYHCEYNGEIVYISATVLHPDFPQTMEATGFANVRLEPNGEIIGTLQPGEDVRVAEYDSGWLKFTFERTGQAAYVYSGLMQVAN